MTTADPTAAPRIGAPPLHIISGLPFEVRGIRRALPPKTYRTSFSGADNERARLLAEAAADAGPSGLVSFGLAGGLDPALPPGSLILPVQVIDTDGTTFEVSPLWRATLETAARHTGLPIVSGTIATASKILATPEDKARAFAANKACAVDMESGAVARAAQAHDVPFAVLRAVGDPAMRTIPEVAQRAVGPDGRIQVVSLLQGLVAEPAAIGGLIDLGRETRQATRALRRAARELLPALLRLFGAL